MNKIDIGSIKNSNDAAESFVGQVRLIEDSILKLFLLAELLIRVRRTQNDSNNSEMDILELLNSMEKLFNDCKAKLNKRLETPTLAEELFSMGFKYENKES